MISFVSGTLSIVDTEMAIVDVGGIGYGIFMSAYSLARLPAVGEQVKIFTYLNVREDAMQLYGFVRKEDLEIFKMLICVNGIGPKAGLSILSTLTSDELRFAVVSGDVKSISASPGVGKKTAEKLIIELKDKLKLSDIFPADEDGDMNYFKMAGDDSEAVQALVALGYGQGESLKAVKAVGSKDKSVEEILKEALGKLI
ncbi:MAG: Holliday junction branch migration protein RuvA [Lachnospiraceae bacterium]|nr:Holliday junction branch migration protein RuvA [Lachnospiraceae bacterium]